jgi:hypothetical protein
MSEFMPEFRYEFRYEFRSEFRFDFMSDLTLDVELIFLNKFVISNVEVGTVIEFVFIYQLLSSIFSG